MDVVDRLNMRTEYQILNDAIRDEIRRSASSVVSLGYMLRRMMDEKLWEGHYDSLDEYLRQELHMDYTQACRFEAINRKYSIGGRNMHIDDKWEGYSQSVLIEMLNMPPELEEKVTPDMTVRQVREMKRQARQEKEKEKEKVRAESAMEKSVAGISVTADAGQQEHVASRGVPEEPDQPGQQGSGYQEIPVRGEILDAEFREVGMCEVEMPVEDAGHSPEPELQETVATSQPEKSAYGLEKSVYPEGSLIAEAGCGNKYDCFSCAQDCGIRQKYRYCMFAPLGNPFGCDRMESLEGIRKEMGERCQFINNSLANHTAGTNEAAPCCTECTEDCAFRCRRSRRMEADRVRKTSGGSTQDMEPDLWETVATPQCPELDRPDKMIKQYLDDFAEDFISGNIEWILADYRNRAQDVAPIPGEIKKYLGLDGRVQCFKSRSKPFPELMHITLFDDYIQLCTGIDTVLGNFDWFYLAAAIQRKWPTVIEKMVNAGKEPKPVVTVREQPAEPQVTVPEEQDGGIKDELAEVGRILAAEQKTLNDYLAVAAEDGEFPERLMFKQKAIVAALEAYACSLEAESEAAQEPEEKKQPPLPPLKNNNQRKEWLRFYKDWGLWYRDENIGVDYYKYDFENGARLIAEVYQEEATKYCDAYESSHFHLVGGPKPPEDQHGICRWQRHGKYSRYPNSETELVEFLKELQKK